MIWRATTRSLVVRRLDTPLQQRQQRGAREGRRINNNNNKNERMKRNSYSIDDGDDSNSSAFIDLKESSREYFTARVISNESLSIDETVRVLTLEIDDDIVKLSALSNSLKLNKEHRDDGKTRTGRVVKSLKEYENENGDNSKRMKNSAESDFNSDWLNSYTEPGMFVKFKLFPKDEWTTEDDVVDFNSSRAKFTNKIPIAQSPTDIHMARRMQVSSININNETTTTTTPNNNNNNNNNFTKAEFIVDVNEEPELATLPTDARLKVSLPRGLGFSNPLYTSEKRLSKEMMDGKKPIIIICKGAQGVANAKALLSWPALLAHASIAPVTLFALAESNQRLAIDLDEVEKWRKKNGVKVIISIMESIDYQSLTIRSALEQPNSNDSSGNFPNTILGSSQLEHGKAILCMCGLQKKETNVVLKLFTDYGVQRENVFIAN
jgi:hypothetical protein